ncbi:hypothetical protein I6G65_16005 [Sphingomonas paucimobilis]|uniref:DNA, contig: SP630 n=1 Tax=Sphingomonas paucimobilis NBRC 13935 TaxID=1219050 RepID=A0A0C9M305_SPHPI|nr:hypothetical protein [Sphingomonas paucimobilis]QPS15794.1 hypothetical protein I6G65_16005 [Sphingomonas paucimobilis]GAN14135.1 hypothetical protein SP6_30_02760 [Sphingomonas paucimobilis NBRC 13935]SUJ08238.1 Uncharacterised protein [Sphingomonas paucimobilis]
MKIDHHKIDATLGPSVIITAPVAVSHDPQNAVRIGVQLTDMPRVGSVIGITISCPAGTMMVTLDEDQATAFAIELTAAQLTHAQANDRSIVQ